jgi:hypothetical protein
MEGKVKAWFAAGLLAFLFAVACNGQAGDAISSIASNRPSGPGVSFSPSISLPSRATPTEVPSEAPTETPTEAPSEAPTEAPTGAPTEAPTEKPTKVPTETPTQAPTEAPTQKPTQAPTEAPTQEPTVSPTEAPTPTLTASPSPSGTASSGTSPAIWWGLALLAAAALGVLLWLRSRNTPSATMQQAYAASAAVRDRLAQEVSAPSAAPGALEALVDEADSALRAVEASAPDPTARTAVDTTLRAINDVRGALALRATTAGAAHVSGADVEARLLRALAALDAALGPLRDATGGPPPSTTGFEV